MAEEIARNFPEAEVECVPGRAGSFQVIIDGTVLFDKKMTGRFPENGEILGLMK